jgi:dTDP-4-amino-4,6-dideoxygalactose transaminase
MIPFLSLKDVTASFEPELSEAVARVVKSGWYLLGEETKRFEGEFAAYCRARHCVGVANGLDALIIILRAYKKLGRLTDGDEVLVPANTYIATILAISACDLVPVLVEPSLDSFCIDPDAARKAVSARSKAIMPVHLYGQVCDMEAIRSLADERGLLVIEDAAQAHGASRGGRRAGAFGDAAGFSF